MIPVMQPCAHSLRHPGARPALRHPAALFFRCLVTAVFSVPFAAAQEPPVALTEASTPPEARAADDAFQNLVDRVLALRLEDDLTTVAEFLTLLPGASPATTEAAGRLEYELRRALLAECQTGSPRRLAGGGVEIDLWLSAPRLEEILKSLAAAQLPKEKHARVALHASCGPAVTATGCYLPDGRARDPRPGWRHCAPDQIAQTRAAVHLDVHRRLLDHLAGTRLAGNDRLRAVMARFPQFRDALLRRVDAVPLGEPTFERLGVCRLSLALSSAQLRDLVRSATADSKEDLPPEVAQLTDLAETNAVVIEGYAVPPPYVAPLARTRPLAEPGRPPWAERVLNVRAAGSAPPGVTDPQSRRDLALKAARLEAARLLWLDIEKLPLASGTLGDHLAGHPRMREAVAAIDALLVPTSSPVFDAAGRATVTLGVRLEPVWQIVRNLK